jgi:thioredoxin reductase
LQVQKVAWSERAAKKLEFALMGDSIQIQNEVENGISELWLIDSVSYLVTRVEHDLQNNRELVFVAGAGENAVEAIEYFKEKAKKHGIKTMRLHSGLKGMQRLIKKTGFKAVETVYKVSI